VFQRKPKSEKQIPRTAAPAGGLGMTHAGLKPGLYKGREQYVKAAA